MTTNAEAIKIITEIQHLTDKESTVELNAEEAIRLEQLNDRILVLAGRKDGAKLGPLFGSDRERSRYRPAVTNFREVNPEDYLVFCWDIRTVV